MKKLGFSFMAVMVLLSVTAQPAKADIFESNLFEPILLCGVGGTIGYLGASAGQQILMGAVLCGAGAAAGLLINAHYKSKDGKVYEKDIRDLRAQIKEYQLQQALKSSRGEDDTYANRVMTVVPGQRLPDGSILRPTLKEQLIPAGENLRDGD
jgi:hypothetical protein